MRPRRLLFCGSFLGRHPGYPPDYTEKLARLLTAEGHAVRTVSSSRLRLLRLVETVAAIIAWRAWTDLVLVNVFSGPAFGLADAASLTARRLGKPVVMMLHGGNLPAFTQAHPQWTGRVFQRAAAFSAPSRYLAEGVALPQPAQVIPNIVPIEDYPFRARRAVQPRLLWMRTFAPEYRPAMAVETLLAVQRRHPAACLTMAGRDQGHLSAIQAQVRAANLHAQVQLPGFLDRPAKQHALAHHDIFINTNRIDNMPISLIEALAAGLPVVATRVGGIPFLLEHERTGLLVADGDAAGMADAVERLLTDADLAERLSRQGRALAETFTWPSVKPLWENLLASYS